MRPGPPLRAFCMSACMCRGGTMRLRGGRSQQRPRHPSGLVWGDRGDGRIRQAPGPNPLYIAAVWTHLLLAAAAAQASRRTRPVTSVRSVPRRCRRRGVRASPVAAAMASSPLVPCRWPLGMSTSPTPPVGKNEYGHEYGGERRGTGVLGGDSLRVCMAQRGVTASLKWKSAGIGDSDCSISFTTGERGAATAAAHFPISTEDRRSIKRINWFGVGFKGVEIIKGTESAVVIRFDVNKESPIPRGKRGWRRVGYGWRRMGRPV